MGGHGYKVSYYIVSPEEHLVTFFQKTEQKHNYETEGMTNAG